MSEKLRKTIDAAIKNVWTEDLKQDYANYFLLKEDTLKNAFYFHLRNRLGEAFLYNHNLRLFTEYYIDGQRIDLVIVEIDPNQSGYLGDCVTSVLAVIEMKYKGAGVKEAIFYQDIEKVLTFIKKWQGQTNYYLAFIREKYFKSEEIVNWLEEDQALPVKDKLTELYAYWNEDTDETEWQIFDY